MIFLTVGSALPFDRLVKLVDDAVRDGLIDDEVFAQIGDGKYEPSSIPFTRFLSKPKFQEQLANATAVISHAGIGTITDALKENVPLLVFPRSPAFGELVDDHQEKTARAFSVMGHLLVFRDAEQLKERLSELTDFRPKPRHPKVAGVAKAIAGFLDQVGMQLPHVPSTRPRSTRNKLTG